MEIELEFKALQQAQTLDEQQMRRIMQRYGEEIWNYIYYLTGNSEMADDLAQEVFVKCYYRIGTYRGTSTFKAWLFTIARNTVFSYRKSRYFRLGLWGGQQHPLSAFDTDQQERLMVQAGVSASAEMEYMGNRQVAEIWEIIMKLPLKLREVLVLDLKAELSVREIAGLTALPEGTVKSRLHRARRKVQEQLRGRE
ncbi:RNA polymerase sigma factor [Paenibacillus tepidiphilus]|uniref:RNA polymerase sigma factor n=1 Tax=Paenibacillus tepidiphilus TaxID=2608683 RepID=UPI001EF03E79|nr:RNA polymerase sigma factor [Paenibacillus tepidiphilus]